MNSKIQKVNKLFSIVITILSYKYLYSVLVNCSKPNLGLVLSGQKPSICHANSKCPENEICFMNNHKQKIGFCFCNPLIYKINPKNKNKCELKKELRRYNKERLRKLPSAISYPSRCRRDSECLYSAKCSINDSTCKCDNSIANVTWFGSKKRQICINPNNCRVKSWKCRKGTVCLGTLEKSACICRNKEQYLYEDANSSICGNSNHRCYNRKLSKKSKKCRYGAGCFINKHNNRLSACGCKKAKNKLYGRLDKAIYQCIPEMLDHGCKQNRSICSVGTNCYRSEDQPVMTGCLCEMRKGVVVVNDAFYKCVRDDELMGCEFKKNSCDPGFRCFAGIFNHKKSICLCSESKYTYRDETGMLFCSEELLKNRICSENENFSDQNICLWNLHSKRSSIMCAFESEIPVVNEINKQIRCVPNNVLENNCKSKTDECNIDSGTACYVGLLDKNKSYCLCPTENNHILLKYGSSYRCINKKRNWRDRNDNCVQKSCSSVVGSVCYRAVDSSLNFSICLCEFNNQILTRYRKKYRCFVNNIDGQNDNCTLIKFGGVSVCSIAGSVCFRSVSGLSKKDFARCHCKNENHRIFTGPNGHQVCYQAEDHHCVGVPDSCQPNANCYIENDDPTRSICLCKAGFSASREAPKQCILVLSLLLE